MRPAASALILVALALGGRPSAGQDRLYLPVDPEAASALERIEELAARGQWNRVVSGLDRLLREGGASLLRTEEGLRSVRAEARRRLLELPPEGRAAYALAHEEEAKRLFAQARREAGVELLAQLLAEHPASELRERARRLLASRLVERGQPGAALPHVEALLAREGQRGDELEALRRLRAMCLALAGRGGEARDAIAELSVDEPTRSRLLRTVAAAETPELPLPAAPDELAWSRPVFGYYEKLTEGSPPWSVAQADVARVYVQDGSHAMAVRLDTGKLAWRTPLREEDAFQRPEGRCPLALGQGVVACLLPGGRGLVGLERLNGRELWRRSLDAVKQAAEIDFPAHVPASAPPVVLGEVLVLPLVSEHQDREVHLVGLDLLTGAPRWSAFLASETGGSTPHPALVVGEGVVFVSSGHGAVAAVDARGEVLWLREYPSSRDAEPRRRHPFGRPQPAPGAERPARIPRLIAARGAVWSAPADAQQVFCYDARSGEQRAALDVPGRVVGAAGTGILAFGAGKLLRVTRAGVETVLQLEGKLVAEPALAGARVYLPRGFGVWAVDLEEEEARRVLDWGPSSGRGNLVVAGGRLLVSAPRGLYAFGAESAPAPELGEDELLAALGDPRFAAREEASRRLLEAGEARRAELEAAGEEADPEVALRARMLLGELDRVVRLDRWRPLVKEEWTEQVADLLNRLSHPNPEVRLEVLSEMGRGLTGDEDLLVLMRDLLADRDARVAFRAATVLFERGDREGHALLVSTFRGGIRGDRLVAARLLIDHGKPEDADVLAEGLGAEDEELRAQAVRGVLKLAGEAGLERVRPLLGDPADRVRLALLNGLRRLPPERVVGLLAVAVDDANDAVRAQAVEQLEQTRGPDTYTALGKLLGDPVRETAQRAARYLYSIAQQDDVLLLPVAGLERGAALQDAQIRNYVAQIALWYGHRGGLLSLETLVRFLSDPIPDIRGYVIRGRDPQGRRRKTSWKSLLDARVRRVRCTPAEVERLAELALHEESELRLAAYQTLVAASGAPARGVVLAQGLGDADAAVRERCAEWLQRAEPEHADLLAPASLEELLRMAGGQGRAEGSRAAAKLLSVLPEERLFAGLLPLLPPAEPAAGRSELLRREAARRLCDATHGAVPYDAARDPAELAPELQAWVWGQANPGLSPELLLAELGGRNPTKRWNAAKKLASLPTPAVRRALLDSLAGESIPWVLEGKLAALVAVTGRSFGFRKKLPPVELKACAARFQAWAAEQREEPR